MYGVEYNYLKVGRGIGVFGSVREGVGSVKVGGSRRRFVLEVKG